MAVLTKSAFLNQTISTNQTIATIDYYLKTYIASGQTGNITLTLPFAGGGAPVGCIIHAVNIHAALNLTVTYKSGLSAVLLPGQSASFIFSGSDWKVLSDLNGLPEYDFSSKKLETSDIVTHNYPGLTVERVITPKAYLGAASETGAIEIKLPLHSENSIKLLIEIKNHGSANTTCIIEVAGYLKDQTNIWHATYPYTTQVFGEYAHTKNIQLGFRTIAGTKYATILIGGIADVWNYLSIQILEIHSAVTGLTTAWQDSANYSISIVNPLSGDYTNQYTTYPSIYGLDSFNRIRKLGTLGIERTLEFTDADGSVSIYPNAYTLDAGTTIKARNAGVLQRLRLEGSDGKAYLENSASLAADATATFTPPIGQNRQLFPLGFKTGLRLIFQSTTTPPTIEAGSLEVKGRLITQNSDINMSGSNRAALPENVNFANWPNLWFLVAMSEFGELVYSPWFPDTTGVADIVNVAMTSASLSGFVLTVTIPSTAGMAAGQLVRLSGTTDGAGGNHDGTFRVDTVPGGGTTFTVRSALSGTASYTGGTVVVRYPMKTLHGTGSWTGITPGTDVTKFTPTLIYDPIYGGYYINQLGTPTTVALGGIYRVFGMFYTDNAGLVVNDMISFGQCKEKNDNYIESDGTTTSAVASGTSFRLAIPTRFSKIWGTDYIAEDEATPTFFRITAQTKLKYWFSINIEIPTVSSTSSTVRLRENGVIKKYVSIGQGVGITLGKAEVLSNVGKLNNLSYIDLVPLYDSTTPPSIASLEVIFSLDNGD